MTTVYARRRLVCLWLPFITLGMAVYMGSYAYTLTFNGLSLLGVGVVGIGTVAASLDAGEDS